MKKSPFAVAALLTLVLSLGGCVWGPGYGYHGYNHGGGNGWHGGGGGYNHGGGGWH
jgi:hypothetical protein